ncbi:Rossmann-fold NAD(P)-binding domain-containing protein [Membranihabitans marinus]|uniref:acetylornithine carbamoyltransferase n=1 Tax=Membranihabitans marinus TaxID=1227546 RepID=UPI001F25EED8|nr:acetylornithine carbamoyltransferase [Membranihabitans marinus]
MDNFIDLTTIEDIRALAQAGIDLKQNADPSAATIGLNKILTCLYLNPSLRTKLSTEIAAKQLGMHCINLAADSAWTLETRAGAIMNEGAAEHIKEQAMVLSEYSDIIAIRAFPKLKDAKEDYQNDFISKFAKYSKKPIVNLESGSLHPLQGLADLMTIMETINKPNPKIVLSWAPHPRQLPQSVANSFSDTIQKAGYDLTICCPEGMELSDQYAHHAKVSHDQMEAFEDADIIYVKNWSSYHSYGATYEDANWMITGDKMAKTNNANFMHCLPVRRNVVVADEVIDSPNSIIDRQVSNRVHAAKIVLHSILNR